MTTALRHELCKDTIFPTWVNAGRIPNLDGLRAVGILLVLCDHWIGSGGSRLPATIRYLPSVSAFGVNIFFAISGFLITLLMLREYDRTGSVSLRGFYRRRALRILPAYITFLIFVAALAIAGVIKMGTIHWLACLTYTVNFLDPHTTSWVTGHIWSLSVEEHFYLVWPLIVVSFGPKRALKVLIIVVAASPVLRVIFWQALHDKVNQGFLTPCRLDSIGMGCLLAYFVRDPRLWQIMARLRHAGVIPLAFVLTLGVVFLGIFLRNDGRIFALGRSLESAGIAAFLLLVVSSGTGLISRVLGSRPMVGTGVLSYSLYLWQQPFLWKGDPTPLVAWPENIIVALLVAIASYWVVERPFLKIKERVPGPGSQLKARPQRQSSHIPTP